MAFDAGRAADELLAALSAIAARPLPHGSRHRNGYRSTIMRPSQNEKGARRSRRSLKV